MSKRIPFVVEVIETVVHRITVQARDSDEAQLKAHDLWVDRDNDPYYAHSDWEFGQIKETTT